MVEGGIKLPLRWYYFRSKECLPYLKKSNHAHILNISPPLLMSSKWFSPHVAYTMAKYGMSMCVLGMHEEFKPFGIGVNALWPRTGMHKVLFIFISELIPLFKLSTQQLLRCYKEKDLLITVGSQK